MLFSVLLNKLTKLCLNLMKEIKAVLGLKSSALPWHHYSSDGI